VSALRRSLIPLLFIAFVAASITTAIFYGFFAIKLRSISSKNAGQTVVVAARPLERGRILTAADVKLASWGGTGPLEGGYATVDQTTGKTVYNTIEENEPLTKQLIASVDGIGGGGVATGMRAISVHASDSNGVLSLMRVGQKVDVQVVSERRNGDLTLLTMLQNLEVLAMPPPDSNGGRPPAPVVTLLVTPEAADQLGLADSGARIRLLLRNPLDPNQDPRMKMTLTQLFNEEGGETRRQVKRSRQHTLAAVRR